MSSGPWPEISDTHAQMIHPTRLKTCHTQHLINYRDLNIKTDLNTAYLPNPMQNTNCYGPMAIH